MFGLLAFAVTSAAVIIGFVQSKLFVQRKLRYVDGALSSGAAIAAGIGATLVAWPVAWLLPLISGGTAIAFGLAVGLGTRAGASDIKHGYRLRG